MISRAQVAQHMAYGFTQRNLLSLIGLFLSVRHSMRAYPIGVLFLPHSRQCGLTLILGLFRSARTKHLLLREHHSAPLSRRKLPDTSSGSLRSRRSHSLEFPLLFGECHHFHSSAPFSCVRLSTMVNTHLCGLFL